MAEKNNQPEFDMLIKYGSQFLTQKLEGMIAAVQDKVSPPEPEPANAATPPSVPDAVNAKIDRVLQSHSLPVTVGAVTVRVCKCGAHHPIGSGKPNAQAIHLREEIVKALSTPDPTVAWWKSVTDQV